MKTDQLVKLVFALLIALVLGRWIAGSIGSGAEQAATPAEAPVGFFNVRWYATMDEVKATRPNVAKESDDTLVEKERLYGEDVRVNYVFKNGRLVLFVMTFASPATQETYAAMQTKLIQEYGAMSSPGQRADCRIFSERKVDKLVVNHCLRMKEGQNPEHQLLFYRTVL